MFINCTDTSFGKQSVLNVFVATNRNNTLESETDGNSEKINCSCVQRNDADFGAESLSNSCIQSQHTKIAQVHFETFEIKDVERLLGQCETKTILIFIELSQNSPLEGSVVKLEAGAEFFALFSTAIVFPKSGKGLENFYVGPGR